MTYDLFLFDADDTLFDFQKSESFSFRATLSRMNVRDEIEPIFQFYKKESAELWSQLERGLVTKDFLKVERFRRTFAEFRMDLSAEIASGHYLDYLEGTVLLLDDAVEICQLLSQRGEVGIITNGIEKVQKNRLKNSLLAPYVSFVAVSEECGFAKPDARFFEYSVGFAKKFSKTRTLVIGDRLETDVQGAHNFGIDACYLNPSRTPIPKAYRPRYEIHRLSELRGVLEL